MSGRRGGCRSESSGRFFRPVRQAWVLKVLSASPPASQNRRLEDFLQPQASLPSISRVHVLTCEPYTLFFIALAADREALRSAAGTL